MPQPLSPASRWLLKLSLSSTECFRKKSPSPSTASTTRSGDSHESSGKSGPPSIRSLGTQFGFGKSPSGEKVIACCGGEHELALRRFNSTTTTIGLAHPHAPTSPRPPMPAVPAVPLVPALPPLFSRASLEPTPTPLSPRLAQLPMSKAQSTRYSIDGVKRVESGSTKRASRRW